MDVDDDPSVHRLEASAPVTGGLVVKKKDSGSTFKVPKPSLLGLDRLAAEKRKEREDQKRLISFKESEYDDDVSSTPRSDSGAQRTPDVSSVHKLNRQYREAKDETPSHGGGVSDKARQKLAEHTDKEKRGVYVSSKDRKRSGRDDERDRNYDSKYRRDYRDRDRDRDRERDRDRNRDRDRRYDKDRHSSRSDRRKSDSERSLHTPRFKDEPKTPYTAATASASWDDEDEKSSKRSSWDFPTPKDDAKRSEWSTRSSSSSIYRMKNKGKIDDDTPRPTPAHKFNPWANDRKKSGATPQTGEYLFQKYYSDQPTIRYLHYPLPFFRTFQ